MQSFSQLRPNLFGFTGLDQSRRGISFASPLMISVRLMMFALPPASAEAKQSDTNRAPNIVLIFADDLGWKDVAYQGSDYYQTPNIDRLASQGMVFSAAYAAAGNCQPSRASLMSGQYTPRQGIYAVSSTERGPKPMMRAIPVPNRDGLAEGKVTIAEA